MFTEDERLKLLSFTGSPAVGWALKAKAGKKKVVLELGGNAAVIVDQDADLDHALERIVFGAFYQSGQSCIGVQRILIHEAIYDKFKAMLVDKTRTLVAGNPHDRETFIGPMISEKEAQRLKGWIDAAVDAGATLLCGGKLDGAMLEATLLENVPASLRRQQGGGVRARSPTWRSSPTGAGAGRGQQLASSGSRRASSPRTSTRCSTRGTRSRSAAWWSTTSRRTGSTTCPTAGSRIPASAAKASASRWRT